MFPVFNPCDYILKLGLALLPSLDLKMEKLKSPQCLFYQFRKVCISLTTGLWMERLRLRTKLLSVYLSTQMPDPLPVLLPSIQ